MLSDLMSHPAIEFALNAGFGLIGLALLLAFIRLIKGPTMADRIAALDLLSGIALSAIVLLCLETGRSVYLNVGVCLAALSFLATVALALYLSRKSDEKWNT